MTPANVTQGYVSYNATLYGDTASVSCNPGYTPSVNVIECTARGTWDIYPSCDLVGNAHFFYC